MVLGLPKVSCTEDVCPSSVLDKQHQDPFPKWRASRATSIGPGNCPFLLPHFPSSHFVMTIYHDQSSLLYHVYLSILYEVCVFHECLISLC